MPITATKRPADNSLVAVPQLPKRIRSDEIQTYKDKQLLEKGVHRVSNLFAPIMKLEGHESDIFTCEFHPDGDYLGKNNNQESFQRILTLFPFPLSFVWIRQENLFVVGLWRGVSERVCNGWPQRCSDGAPLQSKR